MGYQMQLTYSGTDVLFAPLVDGNFRIPESRDRRIYEGYNGNLIINEISAKLRWEIPINNIPKADYDNLYTWWSSMYKLTFTPDTDSPLTIYKVRIATEEPPLKMMWGVGWADKYEGMLVLEQVPSLS
jgi:hypothetical protein